jgi:hypothetical protein
MAMLNESNLLAMKAKAAKFRTHHVGTKLNEAELHEFEALAEKRKQSPSELIDTIPKPDGLAEAAATANPNGDRTQKAQSPDAVRACSYVVRGSIYQTTSGGPPAGESSNRALAGRPSWTQDRSGRRPQTGA